MNEIEALAGTARVATAHDTVLNNECCYTFHSPFTSDAGIVVSLNSFMGTVPELAMLSSNDNDKALFVRIVKKRVEKELPSGEETTSSTTQPQPQPQQPTKLGIGVQGGFQAEDDKYEIQSKHSVVVLEKNNSSSSKPTIVAEVPYTDETKSTFPQMVVKSVDAILCHVGMTTQQEVKVWQLDEHIPISKYCENLPFADNGVVIDPHPSHWRCQASGDTENLWLNLSDGYIGGGRKNWDGSGGSNGALDHYHATNQQYPLVVKLGTITADIETADCYSYAPDEDGPVKIPNLAELLEKRGINVAAMQKTVKSTAELEVELNANYNFDAITESGCELVPVSGPGLQGLQNLGNSCYMNSVVQLLLSGTVPELAARYGTTSPGTGSITQHSLLTTSVSAKNAPLDLLCQTTKMACALTSGVFSQPESELQKQQQEEEDNNNGATTTTTTTTTTDPKYRLAPRMLKHVVGKDHVDFRTGQQQDAAQFLQYFLERLDRAELAASKKDILPKYSSTTVEATATATTTPPVPVASHLFSFATTERLVCSADGRIKYKNGAPETIWSLRIPMDKAVVVVMDQQQDEGSNNNNNNNVKEDVVTSPEHKRQKSAEEEKDDNNKKKPIPTVSFQTCVEEWAQEVQVDGISWPHLQNAKHAAMQRTRLSNFPRYLTVQLQRYELGPDWAPIKLEVNVDIPEEIDLDAYKSCGPQEGENLVPEEGEESAPSAAAAVAPQAPAIDETALSQLMDMGFSLNSCKRALTAVGGSNVEAAMTWVFEHNMDPDFNDPLPEPSSSANQDATGGGGGGDGGGVDEGVVQSLVSSLGCFTADQVRAALKETGGAADRAADWLFSHMDDLDGAIAALQSREATTGTNNSNSAPSLPLDDSSSGKYTMVGMISHIGKNTHSGHYVAHLKKDGKWVIFNDEKVALSSKPPLQHAYLYLFQRKDTIGSPDPKY